MNSINQLTASQLRKAAALKESISRLEKQLVGIFGAATTPAKAPVTRKAAKRKRIMSAAGRARIAAAQKARWAKIKATKKS